MPRTLRLCVRFKYASFYRRFQSFLSLFGSLFSLVSISILIYFNRLQNCGALELNYFVFETFYLLTSLASVSRLQGPFVSQNFSLWSLFSRVDLFSISLVIIGQNPKVMLTRQQYSDAYFRGKNVRRFAVRLAEKVFNLDILCRSTVMGQQPGLEKLNADKLGAVRGTSSRVHVPL